MSSSQRLQDRAIIVVGSATGIGAATVRRLVDEGARLCLADINSEGAESLAEEVRRGGGDAFAVPIDLADEASVAAAFSEAVKGLGGIRGVHINAADMSVLNDDSDALAEDLAVFDRDPTGEPSGAPALYPRRSATPAECG